jgi:hypothetical protein
MKRQCNADARAKPARAHQRTLARSIVLALDALGSEVERPRENQRQRKTRQRHVDDYANEIRRPIQGRRERGDDLDDDPGGNNVYPGDAKYMTPPELGKKLAHSSRSLMTNKYGPGDVANFNFRSECRKRFADYLAPGGSER